MVFFFFLYSVYIARRLIGMKVKELNSIKLWCLNCNCTFTHSFFLFSSRPPIWLRFYPSRWIFTRLMGLANIRGHVVLLYRKIKSVRGITKTTCAMYTIFRHVARGCNICGSPILVFFAALGNKLKSINPHDHYVDKKNRCNHISALSNSISWMIITSISLSILIIIWKLSFELVYTHTYGL